MAYILLLAAYGTIATLSLVVGLATAPRPMSAGLVTVAALLWPLTMGAITLYAYVVEPWMDRWADPKQADEGLTGHRGSVRARYALRASGPSRSQVL